MDTNFRGKEKGKEGMSVKQYNTLLKPMSEKWIKVQTTVNWEGHTPNR